MKLQNNITAKGIAVWLVCALFFIYECLLRTVLGTFQSSLMSELYLTTITFAFLSSTAYSLMFGPMQFAIGFIVDRFGIKKTMFVAVLICTVANIGFACSPTYTVAIIFRVVMGLGSSFGFICLLVTVYDWMPRNHIAFFIGLSQFIGTLGPMIAAGPLNALSNFLGVSWREIFILIAFSGLIIAFLVIFIVDKNKQHESHAIILRIRSNTANPIRKLLGEKQVWYIALFSACVYFSLEYLSENECQIFLKQKGFSDYFSAYMITVAWLGYAFGCVVMGYFSDKFHRRKSVMLASALLVLIALTGIIYLSLNEFLTAFCFILLGVGASGQSIGFAIMAEQCKEASLAVGLGINNAMIVAFVAIFPPFIGSLLKYAGQKQSLIMTYQYAFLVMMALSILAVILAGSLIRETYCKSVRENTPLTRPRYS
ncbi:MFS transporter [Legionella israelensis]|uniref:MFS transporter n=1 Tax=Legionella israelensis TaxID=454 RepID=UPI00117D51DE|nr:MFS transporter [Legionella israelensis]QDP73252.1 MFS transporter [Legionella israelensis]